MTNSIQPHTHNHPPNHKHQPTQTHHTTSKSAKRTINSTCTSAQPLRTSIAQRTSAQTTPANNQASPCALKPPTPTRAKLQPPPSAHNHLTRSQRALHTAHTMHTPKQQHSASKSKSNPNTAAHPCSPPSPHQPPHPHTPHTHPRPNPPPTHLPTPPHPSPTPPPPSPSLHSPTSPPHHHIVARRDDARDGLLHQFVEMIDEIGIDRLRRTNISATSWSRRGEGSARQCP